MQRGRDGEQGLGVLEVLLALSIFAFVALALAGLIIGTISASATAHSSSVASSLARQSLEEAASSANPVEGTRVIRVPSDDGRDYTVATAIVRTGNLIDITVTTSWRMSFASACVGSTRKPSCVATERTMTRQIQTRLYRP